MSGNGSGIKACALCGKAFFGTSEDMACSDCEARYRRLRDQVREYLWHQPGQVASIMQISADLGVPMKVMRALMKDPRFKGKGLEEN